MWRPAALLSCHPEEGFSPTRTAVCCGGKRVYWATKRISLVFFPALKREYFCWLKSRQELEIGT
jgi:hypothetical protein